MDPVTGTEMFKPKTNQSFILRDRPTSANRVAVNLYERHALILQKKQKARRDEEDRIESMRKHVAKANKFSEQIVQQSKKTKINLLFDRLDSDNDGQISSAQMNTQALNAALQEVFKPLFDELEQLQEPLDRDEFVDATNRLYDTLPQNEKNMILRFGKKQKEKDFELENCTFKPKTNSYVNSQLLSNPASHHASQANVGRTAASTKRPGSAHPT